MYNVPILIRSAFDDNNKYYAEVFLECFLKVKNFFFFISIKDNSIQNLIYEKMNKNSKNNWEIDITQKIIKKKQKYIKK